MKKVLEAVIELAVGAVGLCIGDYLAVSSLPLGFIKIVGSKSAAQINIQSLVQDTFKKVTSEFEKIA